MRGIKPMVIFLVVGCFLTTISAPSALATDWYSSDFGGDWDNSFTWKDSAGNPPPGGQPGEGDSAFLVVPYTFSDYPNYYQPVSVFYRSDTNPLLNQVVIESGNELWQWQYEYNGGTPTVEQLNLRSNVETIGGSGLTFDPPPPEFGGPPPVIFPIGTHMQNAGTNSTGGLYVGGTEGSYGRYYLDNASDSTYGTLSVDSLEIIGSAGEGLFEQHGGVHEVGTALIMGMSGTGAGTYQMTDGTLDAAVEIVGSSGYGEFNQSGGENTTNQLVVGQNPGGEGIYNLSGTGILNVGTGIIGNEGEGTFNQSEGENTVNNLVVGQNRIGVGVYNLSGTGILNVSAEIVGDEGKGTFNQNSGTHNAGALTVAANNSADGSSFALNGGSLAVLNEATVGGAGNATFNQAAGTSFTTDSLSIAKHGTSTSTYNMDGGTLDINQGFTIGGFGEAHFYNRGGEITVGPDERTTGVLRVGEDSSYEMSTGFMTVNGSEYIEGVFRHMGASNTVSTDLFYGQQEWNTLYVGTSSSDAVYDLSFGNVSSPNIKIGSGGLGDFGFRQNGGNVSTTNLDIGYLPWSVSNGIYQLNAGELYVGSDILTGKLRIGLSAQDDRGNRTFANGSLNLEGGTLNVKGGMVVGARGEGFLNIAAGDHDVEGYLNVGTLESDKYASVNQTGGSFDVQGSVKVGIDGFGVINHMSGINSYVGELQVENFVTEVAGYVLGTDDSPDPLPHPKLTVTGVEKIGLTKFGQFEHIHGDHTVNGDLILGDQATGEGLYSQLGGRLYVNGNETIGNEGTGNFKHDLGLHMVSGDLILGQQAGANGTYELASTVSNNLNVYGDEIIGDQGHGEFTVLGHRADHIIHGNLHLAKGDDSSGIYNQYGGNRLEANEIHLADGDNSNATLTVYAGDIETNRFVAAAGEDSNATINFRGRSLTVDGNEVLGGIDSTGEFKHWDGLHQVNGDLYIAQSSYSEFRYFLEEPYSTSYGAELRVNGDVYVSDWGDAERIYDMWGQGNIRQTYSDSTVNIGGKLYVGQTDSRNFYGYRLKDGTLINRGVELVGTVGTLGAWYRTATFYQDGGTHYIDGSLNINAGGKLCANQVSGCYYGNGGQYYLYGGTLFAEDINIYSGDGERFRDAELHIRAPGEKVITTLNISDLTLHNGGKTFIDGPGTNIINGRVDNTGLMTTTGTNVVFNGTFINSGQFGSQDSKLQFDQLVVEPTGYMTGNGGDIFSVSGDFMNGSQTNNLWDTGDVTLVFNGVDTQNFYLAGIDLGATAAGYENNFAWGELLLGSGVSLNLLDGNDVAGAALYIGQLGFEDPIVDLYDLIFGSFISDFNVYYNSSLAGNSFLGGMSYALGGSGFLLPTFFDTPPTEPIPEPSTFVLLGCGLVGLVFMARRSKKKNSA